jgi:hypothetical protein
MSVCVRAHDTWLRSWAPCHSQSHLLSLPQLPCCPQLLHLLHQWLQVLQEAARCLLGHIQQHLGAEQHHSSPAHILPVSTQAGVKGPNQASWVEHVTQHIGHIHNVCVCGGGADTAGSHRHSTACANMILSNLRAANPYKLSPHDFPPTRGRMTHDPSC